MSLTLGEADGITLGDILGTAVSAIDDGAALGDDVGAHIGGWLIPLRACTKLHLPVEADRCKNKVVLNVPIL